MRSKNNTGKYLDIEDIQKMLTKFLVDKQMTQEKLAQELDITVQELERLYVKKASSELIIKVNLPLIKLFCETESEKDNLAIVQKILLVLPAGE